MGELLGGLAGEEAGVRVGERAGLFLHRPHDVRMAVPEAGDGGAARGVDIAAPIGIIEMHARAAHGDRIFRMNGAMKDMGHDAFSRADEGQ